MSKNAISDVRSLTDGWRVARHDPGSVNCPNDVNWLSATKNAIVPGTVASTYLLANQQNRDFGYNFDAFDWWYESEFDVDAESFDKWFLNFDGLATIAEVWLNGKSILTSRNMFRIYRVDVTELIKKKNSICMVFRSISADLKIKRRRGRWKTNLVAQQQIRWIRTTLLGRIPGWTPGIQPVGPYRGIQLTGNRLFSVATCSVRATKENGANFVYVEILLENVAPVLIIDKAALSILHKDYPLSVEVGAKSITISGLIQVSSMEDWSPHNYGSPNLYDFSIILTADNSDHTVKSGKVFVRSVELDRTADQLSFVVNGKNIFFRGACWSTNDIVSLHGCPEKLRRVLTLVKNSGANMIRVGGTMTYESDLFYDLCDELGIAVWQDFMFANMDYPFSDQQFREDATQEITEQLIRLGTHPCIVAYCGNSEVEQQAAMFGMTADIWKDDFYYTEIPNLINRAEQRIPYFPSSPCEGALPFHNFIGPSHYFGVGAYRQTLDDLFKSDVKFATECLAFSNMPSADSVKEHFGDAIPIVHSPTWKAGVPRDSSAGWDFEDIRDYYFESITGIDPISLRYNDKKRYFEVSQSITGEIMQATFDHWRHPESACNGGLIWFLNDIVPGAGWGFIDSDGNPKPLYYLLKQCWADIRISFRDRGMDGLNIVLYNDSKMTLNTEIVVQVLRGAKTCIAESRTTITLQQHALLETPVDQMLGRFFDTTYRHQFGPPKHDVVVACLGGDETPAGKTASFLPMPRSEVQLETAVVDIAFDSNGSGQQVSIRSDSFLHFAQLQSKTLCFSENFFHVPPNTTVKVNIHLPTETSTRNRITLSARNLSSPLDFVVNTDT